MLCLLLSPLYLSFLSLSYYLLSTFFNLALYFLPYFLLLFFAFLSLLSFTLFCVFSAVSIGWCHLVLSAAMHTVHTVVCAAEFQHTNQVANACFTRDPSDLRSSEFNRYCSKGHQMTHSAINHRPSSQAIVTLQLLSSG